MDQLPGWLAAAVAAAGVTAYADELVTKRDAPTPSPGPMPEQIPPTLH